MGLNRAVFLDRDGTIIQEIGYLKDIHDVSFIPGVFEAIRRLKKMGFLVIVTTNQSGVARGFFSEEKLQEIHTYMNNVFLQHGVMIDDWYYCPHHIEGIISKYSIECDCRKPEVGMLLEAQKKHNISLKDSFVVGDSVRDIKMGLNAGAKPILVLTGYGLENLIRLRSDEVDVQSYHVARDILDASRIICAY